MKIFALSIILTPFSLLVQSQNSSEFIVHEWGTFTTLYGSNGTQLSGLFVDEEKLPDKAYHLNWRYISAIRDYNDPNKGWVNEPIDTFYSPFLLKNVTVKMETPVIYFYSNKSMKAHVEVGFPNGSISQFYPHPSVMDTVPEEVFIHPKAKLEVDFSIPFNGKIEWDINISNLKDADYDIKTEKNLWNAPRFTESNVITPINRLNEVEKYLFYRGIGHFNPPLKLEMPYSNVLLIENSYHTEIPFYLVFQNIEGKKLIWGYGYSLQNDQEEFVLENPLSFDEGLQVFMDALVEAGLYRDEAMAMINTWRESYFENEGLKIFWILPIDYTNHILPISIYPTPSRLTRVMVGRSEILTPQFEKELFESFNIDKTISKWENDRYYFAYIERSQKLAETGLGMNQLPINTQDIQFEIYPNPVHDILHYQISEYGSYKINLTVRSIDGKSIKVVDQHIKSSVGKLDLSDLQSGMYFISLQTGTYRENIRFIKQ